MVNKLWVLLLSFVCSIFLITATSDSVVSDDEGIDEDVQADGYYFEGPSFEHPVLNQRIRVVLVKTQEEMTRLYEEKTGHVFDPTGKRKVLAFAFPSQNKKFCTLYIPDPREGYRPELLGHELTHCIFGYWHPKQED